MSINPTHVSAAIEPSSRVQGHVHFSFINTFVIASNGLINVEVNVTLNP
jgi:hypothetical protein